MPVRGAETGPVAFGRRAVLGMANWRGGAIPLRHLYGWGLYEREAW